MTYEEALDRVRMAMEQVRHPQTREAKFETALLAVLIQLELLKIDDGEGRKQ